MKQRIYPVAKVTKKAQRALEGGHPWVYAAEITELSPVPENGGLVDVISEKGSYLGTAMYSLHSKIALRILSRNANDSFDEGFFERRIGYAWNLRQTVMDDVSACRVIFGEADGFPGLTVDKYNDILVTQVMSYGIEKRKDIIFPLLLKVIPGINGIFERNDVKLRELEGLDQGKGWYCRKERLSTLTEICENGVYYAVDVENGQKTGFFLDQKYNRAAVARYAKGRRVLDCFTHTGSFALNAALGGAASVTAADISADALALARANAERNGLSVDFIQTDVFDLLPKIEGHPYDFIILDPPAFTKSRKTVDSAERGYREINYRAMKLLPRGGLLATCSCSHFMEDELFVAMLRRAAKDANVSLLQLEARQQACDHPILWGVPETSYLKFYIFEVV